ncbi:arginine--tRNA ligase [Nocardia sp. alder85J]|uniref:arginine--tRNA ligase domain-containing protein n=1 Tax=Nocardia sp. alder85J TaxID=2862949 RepID=UPI001CD53801|nr:arginine--tRNA ligase [Nocardia sp. alder85J]MCX4093188.1 arginine--tRNA ligase [Nocardia sp. alder85J]
MYGRDPDELWEPWRTHLGGQRVLIEHTSINPVHPLHVGSMRGTVIGSTLVELFRSAGADVHTRYFVNDLGRQLHILQRATAAARWTDIPASRRYDEIIGVLYAFANMALADRTADLDRLTTAHPWLADVIDLHAPLPAPEPAPEVVETMLAAAVSDMGHIGAKIDVFEYETDLTIQPGTLIAALTGRCDLVRINGTTCLRLPAGLVPAQRVDGSLLYISRDIANTHHRNPPAWSAMLHVIGADQTLLQTALRHAVPQAALEHVAFGQISHAGRRFSARQNRLTTINDLLQEGGQQKVHELALALALHRRTRPIDLAYLDTTRPLRTVITAAQTAPHAVGDADRDMLRRLLIALLGTPAVLARDVYRRTIHGTARHLLLLSRHYLAATRTGSVPDTVSEWFRHTQNRLAALLGIALDAS